MNVPSSFSFGSSARTSPPLATMISWSLFASWTVSRASGALLRKNFLPAKTPAESVAESAAASASASSFLSAADASALSLAEAEALPSADSSLDFWASSPLLSPSFLASWDASISPVASTMMSPVSLSTNSSPASLVF